MKNLMTVLATMIMINTATAQLKGMESYTPMKTVTYGEKSILPGGYMLRFNEMNWTLTDMGDMITEAKRILEANDMKISDTFMDESDIDLSGDDYYDVYIMAMIMNGYSVMKAWAVETDNGEVYSMTLIMSFAGIQIQLREVK